MAQKNMTDSGNLFAKKERKMTSQELKKEQERINERIEKVAIDNHLCTDTMYPVFDGVFDEDSWLNAKLKVAWILKEPYDDFDEAGNPTGGGWAFRDCFENQNSWKSSVWQKITYVMHGFRNNQRWEDMPYIRNNIGMVNQELQNIVCLNLSKMPSKTYSNMSAVCNKYKTFWKGVVAEQLNVYAPDVIIFGYTFNCMRDSFPNAVEDKERSNEWVRYWKWKNDSNKILLDTYHPGRKGGKYVNKLIEALQHASLDLEKTVIEN